MYTNQAQLVQFHIKMKLLDLPDEILIRVCDFLNIDDLISLFHIHQFALKAKGYFTFYYDENSLDPVVFAQKLQVLSVPTYPIREFENTSDSRTGIVHFLLDPPIIRMETYSVDQVFRIGQNVSNKVTVLAERLPSDSILMFEKLLQARTDTLCFLNLKLLCLERDIDIDSRKLRFPKVETLILEFCTTLNVVSKLNLQNVKLISIADNLRDIQNLLINNFKFDEYSQLEMINLRLEIREDVEDGNVCDFEGVSFGSCKLITIQVHSISDNIMQSGKGILKNLNNVPNLVELELSYFESVINVNAPNLCSFKFILGPRETIQFRNFYSPKLLEIFMLPAGNYRMPIQELENFHAPNLKHVDIDESTLELENTSIVLQNLQSIKTKRFHSWMGRFNPSNLSKLVVNLGEKEHHDENYAALRDTNLTSLRDLKVDFGLHTPCFILESPFTEKFYPNLSMLNLSNIVVHDGSSLGHFLSKFPNLLFLTLQSFGPSYKINGLCIDSLKSLEFNIKKSTENFELTECIFKNLEDIKISSPDPSLSTQGKIEIVSPHLERFYTNLSIPSINFLKFQTTKLKTVSLEGLTFEIELGDIKKLSYLKIRHPFTKLSYTNEPAEFFRGLELKKPFPVVSLEGIKKLYSFSNERKGRDGLPAITW